MLRRTVALCLFSLFLATGFNSPNVLAQSNSPSSAAGLESPIGKVTTVTGTATIEHTAAVVVQANVGDGRLPAKVGDFVYRGDAVQTASDSKISLIFSDGTAFNLSSNARMVLNEFVYDPKGSSNSTLFSLAQGQFTFVAGQVAKTGNMKFDTPVATMGIRGTTPRVEIASDGTVKFSTLVEEDTPGKDAARPAVPHPDDAFQKQRKLNLNICRGC
jgi:hypothetical protein